MVESLSQENLEALFTVFAKTKTISWQSLLNDNSRDSREALKLARDIDEGKFDVAGSRLPLDFHQFYAIFRDTTNDIPWRDGINQQYGIKHDWAFNCMSSNYPVISFSHHFRRYLSILGDSLGDAYFPSPRVLKHLIDFYLSFNHPEEELSLLRPLALQTAYQDWYGKNRVYRNYKFTELVDKPEVSSWFFSGELINTFGGICIHYNSRVYYPIVPVKFINNPINLFKLTDFMFVIR